MTSEVEIPRRAVVRLVRFGFEDGERAARLLSHPDLGLWDLERNEPADPEAGPVVAALARAGDPDLAVRSLHRLVEALDVEDPDGGAAAALLARLRGPGHLRGDDPVLVADLDREDQRAVVIRRGEGGLRDRRLRHGWDPPGSGSRQATQPCGHQPP